MGIMPDATTTTKGKIQLAGDLAGTAALPRLASGAAIGFASTVSSAVATATTSIPLDDTIPQNTEGTEYMTVSYTPKSATSTLEIKIVWEGDNSSASYHMIVALFQDSVANALAATTTFVGTTVRAVTIPLNYTTTSGTTSAITFRVRAGTDVGGTTTFNGRSSGRLFGAIPKSSITVTEYR